MNEKEPRIKVLIKKPYQEIEEVEIDNELKTLQEIVGGLIQIVPFPTVKGVDLIINEEGKLESLDGNFFMPHYEDCTVGNAIMASHDEEGNLASISDKQKKKVKEYIDTFQLNEGEDLYRGFHILNHLMKEKQKVFDKKLKDGEMA